MTSLLGDLGYKVNHAADMTRRDIRIGWRALDEKLSEREHVFRAALGDQWVRQAHQEFRAEIERMTNGKYGNARVVATKPGIPYAGQPGVPGDA